MIIFGLIQIYIYILNVYIIMDLNILNILKQIKNKIKKWHIHTVREQEPDISSLDHLEDEDQSRSLNI
jgi:hypothetical protein